MSLFARSHFRFTGDGAPILVFEDWEVELPGGGPLAFAPMAGVPASGVPAPPPAAAPEPATPPVIAADAAPHIVVEPLPPAVPVIEAPPPATTEPPPAQSLAELELYAQFAHLAEGFNGDQALADLLASDWAAQNGWQGAGGGPIA